MWYMGSLIEACELLVVTCGVLFSDQGSNPGLLHWEHGVLATGPSENQGIPLIKMGFPFIVYPVVLTERMWRCPQASVWFYLVLLIAVR